jgi:hypothetical protein
VVSESQNREIHKGTFKDAMCSPPFEGFGCLSAMLTEKRLTEKTERAQRRGSGMQCLYDCTPFVEMAMFNSAHQGAVRSG